MRDNHALILGRPSFFMSKKSISTAKSIRPLPPVSISEFRGVRSLHLGSSAIQGSMRKAVPDQIELEYVQQMMMWSLFFDPLTLLDLPLHIVQLGLGAASLSKFCYRQFSQAKITAIELNPAVIEICRKEFKLPADDQRLQVLEMDALDYVTNATRHNSINILQADLYDAEAKGPVLDTPEFYQACADCLTDTGMLMVNLFSDAGTRQKNILAMEAAFEFVAWLPEVHDANVVAIAFKRAPKIDFAELFQRAAIIRINTKLPAASWVCGLQKWMMQE